MFKKKRHPGNNIMPEKIRIGTRGSELALWQARHVAGLIGHPSTELVIIKTEGDRIQNVSFDKMEGKGFFTKEIEEALLDKRIDLAVHSLKDLPTDEVPGLKLAVIPERGDFRDMLIMHPDVYNEDGILKIKNGSRVGTSSVRRMAQLLNIDSTLSVQPLRGNVNTRLRKLINNEYDAIVMAKAGVERINLDLSGLNVQILDEKIFLPAPGQGALGLQIRENDDHTFSIISHLSDYETTMTVSAERSFLKNFGGGCQIPLGAYASIVNGQIHLQGLIASTECGAITRGSASGTDPEKTGAGLAQEIKSRRLEI